MPNFYPGGQARAKPAAPAFSSQTGLGGGGGFAAPEDGAEPGKTAFDFSDPVKSIASGIGGVGEFIGGALGGIGELGIEGGPKIKNLGPEAVGSALGAVGGAVGGAAGAVASSPVGQAVGAVGGAAIGVLGAPGRFMEEQEAKRRLAVAGLADDPGVASIFGGADKDIPP
ncbi:MAG: hypothetical protein EPN91_03355, partial [Salinibacterium sp.]